LRLLPELCALVIALYPMMSAAAQPDRPTGCWPLCQCLWAMARAWFSSLVRCSLQRSHRLGAMRDRSQRVSTCWIFRTPPRRGRRSCRWRGSSGEV